MAEVNEYFKEKYEDSQKEFERKLRRHKMSQIYRVVIAVLIIVAILISAYFNYQKMVYSGYEISKSIRYPEATSAKYIRFGENVLRYSQDGASAFSISNDMIWNETFQMQNPMADSCGDFAALGDYMGTTIYVFNSEGLKGTIDTSTPLRSFCVSGTGNVAVVQEEGDITWVKLYNYSGQNIASDKTTMSKSGYPVKVDISQDGIMLSISYLFVDSGVLSSTVAFYNFGAVGQNEIDNLVSGYSYTNTIVSYVKFMNQDTTFAVGDDKFVVFKGSQKPESLVETELTEEVRSVFNNEEYIGLVFDNDGEDGRYKVQVYNDEGILVCTQGFDLEYSDITFYKDLIIIHNAEECEIYNMSGLKKFAGVFDKSVITIIPENKSKYLLVTSDSMEEIKLN